LAIRLLRWLCSQLCGYTSGGCAMALARRAFFLAVLLVLISARSGRADDLFNTISNPTDGSDPVGDLWGPLADSFSTGSSSFQFDSLTVLLSNQLLDPTTSSGLGILPCSGASCGTTSVFLLSNSTTCASSPSCPGATIQMIGSLSNSLLSVTPQDFSFNTSVGLQPNTRYWIELTSTDNNSWWAFDGGGDGEFFANFEGTGSWIVTADNAGLGGVYQMQVAGVPSSSVPEPSGIGLLFAGLAVLGFFRATRRKYQMCAHPL